MAKLLLHAIAEARAVFKPRTLRGLNTRQ